MRGLPIWMIGLLAILTALLLVIGWHDRHEAGYLPFILGILFALFTLGAIGGRVRGEDEDYPGVVAATARDHDRDEPLRRDVRLLGDLLGRVLVEQGGQELLDVEERLPAAEPGAARRPEGPEADAREAEVERIVEGLDVAFETGVIRAFSIYFQLVNAAEQHHRVRRRRQRDAEREAEGRAQPESLAAAVGGDGGARRAAERVQEVLDRIAVELVATAHPTEITRQNVLDKHILVNACLQELDESNRSPRERRDTTERLLEAITILWQTDAMRAERPRVIDEVRRILFFFDHVLEDAAGAVHEELERLLAETYPAVTPPRALLGFGSWAGGDQDGNPNCTPELIGQALDRHRETALRRLRDRVRALAAELAISERMVGVSDALLDSIERDAAGDARGGRGHRRPQPGGALPAQALVRLAAARAGRPPTPTRAPAAMLADLALVEASLEEHRGGRIARRSLARLRRQVELFGFHMARLDVRQHSSRLRAAAGGPGRDGEDAMAPPEREVLATFRELRAAIDRHGPRAAGVVIVSFTHEPADLLAPLALGARDGAGARRRLRHRPGAPLRDDRGPAAARPPPSARCSATPSTGATWSCAATGRS